MTTPQVEEDGTLYVPVEGFEFGDPFPLLAEEDLPVDP